SLANGCICCSIVDGFNVALDTIRSSDPRADRLLIEASGVAIPDQIAAYAHGPGLALDGVITLVDAETIRRLSRDEYVGDVIALQLAGTDLLVLNKVDLVDDATLAKTEEWLRAAVDAPIVRASNGDIDLRVLLDVEPRWASPPSIEPATPPFETWTQSWDAPITRHDLVEFLNGLPASVVRAKGVVQLVDEATPAVVQAVGRRTAITSATTPISPTADAAGTLVMIAVRAEGSDADSVPSTRDE
ncbi:MAG: GTP-binding protein, partial [Ilumatobacter sp.]